MSDGWCPLCKNMVDTPQHDLGCPLGEERQRRIKREEDVQRAAATAEKSIPWPNWAERFNGWPD